VEVSPVVETAEALAAQTDMQHPLPELQLVQVVHVVVATVEAEEVLEAAPVPLIAMAPLGHLVGMTRVVAVAHMMIDPVVIVAMAIEVMVIAMLVVEVAATWSR
jgi:hypothetical protein